MKTLTCQPIIKKQNKVKSRQPESPATTSSGPVTRLGPQGMAAALTVFLSCLRRDVGIQVAWWHCVEDHISPDRAEDSSWWMVGVPLLQGKAPQGRRGSWGTPRLTWHNACLFPTSSRPPVLEAFQEAAGHVITDSLYHSRKCECRLFLCLLFLLPTISISTAIKLPCPPLSPLANVFNSAAPERK